MFNRIKFSLFSLTIFEVESQHGVEFAIVKIGRIQSDSSAVERSGHLTVQTYIVDGSTLTFLGCCVIVWFFSGDHRGHASLLLPGGLDGVISIWTRTINALKK